MTIPLFYDSYRELEHVQDRLMPLLRPKLEAKGLVLPIQEQRVGFTFSAFQNWGRLASQETTLAAVGTDEPSCSGIDSNGFQPFPWPCTMCCPCCRPANRRRAPRRPKRRLSLNWFRTRGTCRPGPRYGHCRDGHSQERVERGARALAAASAGKLRRSGTADPSRRAWARSQRVTAMQGEDSS